MPEAPETWIQQCAVAVQAAALDDSLWPHALCVLRETFAAPAAALETWNAARSNDWSYATAGVDAAGAATIRQLFPETNPRLEANRNIGEGTVTFDYRHASEQELDRCDFVRAMEVHTGTRYYMGAIALRSPDHLCSITLFREPSQGHFAPEQIARLELLLPILKLALRTSMLVGRERLLASLDLADVARSGIVLLNDAGRVVYANRSAHDAARYYGFSITDRLSLARTSDTARLLKILTTGAGAMRAPHPGVGSDLDIICMPVAREADSLSPFRPRVAVILRDADARQPLSGPILRALFDLTDREVEVADALMEGVDLARLAARLGMTVGTARVHIRSLFEKTDTHSQRELVTRLMGYRQPG